MRHQWLPLPQLFAFALLALVLIVAVACGAAEESPTTAPAVQATEAPPAAAMTESTPSSSSGDATVAATATPAAMPDTSPNAWAPVGTFNYGVSGLPPFHVFPTVTEGAAYHHNGYTTAETLLYMNEAREIVPRLFKNWEVAPDGVTWTFEGPGRRQIPQGLR